LGVIDYIISKGILDNILRWILLVPTVAFGILFSFMVFLCIISLCYRYHKWIEQNHAVSVIPVKKDTSNNPNKKFSANTTNNKNSHKENP
jgi:hypothetical protein